MNQQTQLFLENAALREKAVELNTELVKANAKLQMFEKMLIECKEVLTTCSPTMAIGINELMEDWK